MFIIARIGPLGDRQLRGEAFTREAALEDITSALRNLAACPPGTKIEISYEEDDERENDARQKA